MYRKEKVEGPSPPCIQQTLIIKHPMPHASMPHPCVYSCIGRVFLSPLQFQKLRKAGLSRSASPQKSDETLVVVDGWVYTARCVVRHRSSTMHARQNNCAVKMRWALITVACPPPPNRPSVSGLPHRLPRELIAAAIPPKLGRQTSRCCDFLRYLDVVFMCL